MPKPEICTCTRDLGVCLHPAKCDEEAGTPINPLGRVLPEAVDHPLHYGGADNPFEVIKVMEAWLTREEFIGAMKFNIHKYLARARMKNNAEDYAKSAWYNNHLIDFMKRHPDAEANSSG